MNMQLHQLKRINEAMEIRHTRAANIDIRNKWMHDKKIKNYQSEYDRIRTHMDHSIVPHETWGGLKLRKAKLKNLGAQALDGIRN
jgi:uncharacterized protein (DUF111 family)